MHILFLLSILPFVLGQGAREQHITYNSLDSNGVNYEFHGFYKRPTQVEDARDQFIFDVESTCYVGHFVMYDDRWFTGEAHLVSNKEQTCTDWPVGKYSHRMIGDHNNFEASAFMVFAGANFQGDNLQFFTEDPNVGPFPLGSLVLLGLQIEVQVYSAANFGGAAYCIRNGNADITENRDFEAEVGFPFTMRSVRFGCQIPTINVTTSHVATF